MKRRGGKVASFLHSEKQRPIEWILLKLIAFVVFEKEKKAKKFKSYSLSSQKQNPVTGGLWEVHTFLQEMDNLQQASLNKSLSNGLLSIIQYLLLLCSILMAFFTVS